MIFYLIICVSSKNNNKIVLRKCKLGKYILLLKKKIPEITDKRVVLVYWPH